MPARSAATLAGIFAALDGHLAQAAELHLDRAPRGREHGVGDAAGQHDPTGFDRLAPASQVVGGQGECLTRVTLDVLTAAAVLQLAVDMDLDLLGPEVDLVRGHGVVDDD